jgi:hypothetical protein
VKSFRVIARSNATSSLRGGTRRSNPSSIDAVDASLA